MSPLFVANLEVRIGSEMTSTPETSGNPICRSNIYPTTGGNHPVNVTCTAGPMTGRYVFIQRRTGTALGTLILCDVQVSIEGSNNHTHIYMVYIYIPSTYNSAYLDLEANKLSLFVYP